MELRAVGVSPTCAEGQALLAAGRAAGGVILAGGTSEDVSRWAAAARAAGVARIGIDVGMRGGADEALAGIDVVHATVCSADPAAHDLHAGEDGALRRTVALLRAARAARVPVAVTTPISRSNARVLAALPGLLADLAVAAWRVTVPAVEGVWSEKFDARVPRLALAVPYALQAIVTAERAGVAAGIAGAPLCVLGPLRDRALPVSARAFAPACERCPARADCPGVDPAYLRRFGADELSPRALRPAAGISGHVPRDMFSGAWIALSEGAWSAI